MKIKILKTLLIALLFIGLKNEVKAQDKYEFARISSLTAGGKKIEGIYIFKSSKTYEFIEVEWKKNNMYIFDLTPILDQIQKMNEEGWEVITIDAGVYYLKRKIS